MIRYFLSVLFVLILYSQSSAATYYVDCAAANDLGAGTSEATAWKTIAKVNASSFSPNDSILFKRGCAWRGTQLTVRSSGSAGNPITFGAYGGDAIKPYINATALINGSWTKESENIYYTPLNVEPTVVFSDTVQLTKAASSTTLSSLQWIWISNKLYVNIGTNPESHVIEWDSTAISSYMSASIILLDKSYVTIKDLWVGIEWRGTNGRGIVAENGSNITITGCTVVGDKDLSTRGILIYNSPNANVSGNNVSGSMYGIQFDTTGGGYPGVIDGNIIHDIDKGSFSDWDGIKINTSTAQDFTGLIIKNNDVSRFNEDGIDCFNAQNVVIEKNYIHDPISTKYSDNGTGIKCIQSGLIARYNHIKNINTGNLRHGIMAFGSQSEIYYNMIDTVHDYGIIVSSYTTGSLNSKVFNNTVINAGYYAIGVQANSTATVKNNILSGVVADLYIVGASTVVTGGNNLLKKDSGPTISAGGTYISVGNNFNETDPKFISTVDFRLQPESPCIAAGTDVGLLIDIIGNPILGKPDIGAYEYQNLNAPKGVRIE